MPAFTYTVRSLKCAVGPLAIVLAIGLQIDAADSGSANQPATVNAQTAGNPSPTLDDQMQRELQTAIRAISANLYWAPLDHASAARARAEHEAAFHAQLAGKPADEIIAFARTSSDQNPQFAERHRVAEQFVAISNWSAYLKIQRLLVQQFKRQRTGTVDFAGYPNWEQFTSPTDDAGRPSPAGKNRPYRGVAPINILNDKTRVLVIDGPISSAGPVADAEAGWVYCDGELYLVGPDGVPSSPERLASLAERVKSELPPRMQLILQEASLVDRARLHGLSVLRAYRLIHGRYPDFDRYPDWEQMTQPTNAKAEVQPTGKYPPVLLQAPWNPLRRTSGVLEVKQLPAEPIRDASIAWLITRDRRGEAALMALDESGRAYQAMRLNGY